MARRCPDALARGGEVRHKSHCRAPEMRKVLVTSPARHKSPHHKRKPDAPTLDSIAVIGAGAWGTALAQTLVQAGRTVTLWAREPETVADINDRHVNRDVPARRGIGRQAPRHAKPCRRAHPPMPSCSSARRSMCAPSRPSLRRTSAPGQPLVICAKGIEQATGLLMGAVAAADRAGHDVRGAVRPELRGRRRARSAGGADDRLPRRAAGQAARRTPRRPPVSPLLVGRCRRRRARRRVEKRARHRRRHRRRQGFGRQRTRGPRHARICGNAPPGPRARRSPRDHDGPVRPGRSRADVRQPAIAQHEPGSRARRGRERWRPCSANASPSPRASTRPPPSSASRTRRSVEMPITEAVHAFSKAIARWTTPLPA